MLATARQRPRRSVSVKRLRRRRTVETPEKTQELESGARAGSVAPWSSRASRDGGAGRRRKRGRGSLRSRSAVECRQNHSELMDKCIELVSSYFPTIADRITRWNYSGDAIVAPCLGSGNRRVRLMAPSGWIGRRGPRGRGADPLRRVAGAGVLAGQPIPAAGVCGVPLAGSRPETGRRLWHGPIDLSNS